MATPKDWVLGLIAGAAMLVGYSVFPSDTLFEWSVVGLAFVTGLAWAIFHSRPASWRDIGSAALAGCFFIVVGTVTRMWLNEFTLLDTILLVRDEDFVWGYLLPFGYWLLAGAIGYALARCFRKPFRDQHAAQ